MLEDDWEVIQSVLDGKVNRFELLIEKYKTDVFKLIMRMVGPQEVEEVAQEAFIRAFKDLESFRRESPFKHWLNKIAVRTAYDYWRKTRRRKESDIGDKEKEFVENTIAFEGYKSGKEANDGKELLHFALNKLSPEDRLIMTLIYLEEKPLKEVAEMLNMSITNVKVKAFRCKRNLKKVIEEYSRGQNEE